MEKSGRNLSQDPASVNEGAHRGDPKHRVIRAAGLMGLWTFFSRILGMIRDVVSARSFGTSWQWDAFIYAFMIPNFFRRLVGEGALSSAFIPVYSETREKKGQDEAFRFANVALTVIAAGLLVFLFIVELALYGLLQIDGLPSTLHLTFDLLRILFPYLWFISVFALGMGILHCHRHFFAPALGPVILNVAWIAGILWLVPRAGTDAVVQLKSLASVLLAAGAIQLTVEIPAVYRLGFRPRWVWDWMSVELQKAIKLLLPAILGFAVVQINILVDMTLALTIGAGANSSLWYGTRLMQFPLGIFAIAIGTALLPTISHHTAKNEVEHVRSAVSFSLRTIFLIILPASVGLIALRTPIIQLLFERGAFDATSTARTAAVLLGYAIGLFAYSGQKIMAAGFHAVQDTKTPVKIGVIALLANIVFNLILMIPFREAGLALATSLSGILQFFLLFIFYEKRIAKLEHRNLIFSFIKIALASSLMGVCCVLFYPYSSSWIGGDQLIPQILRVLLTIGLSAIFYFALCFCFRIQELGEVLHWAGRGRK